MRQPFPSLLNFSALRSHVELIELKLPLPLLAHKTKFICVGFHIVKYAHKNDYLWYIWPLLTYGALRIKAPYAFSTPTAQSNTCTQAWFSLIREPETMGEILLNCAKKMVSLLPLDLLEKLRPMKILPHFLYWCKVKRVLNHIPI